MELLSDIPHKSMNKIKNQCRTNGLVSIFEQFKKWECNESRIIDCSNTIDVIYENLSPFDAELLAYSFFSRLHSQLQELFGIKYETNEICKDDFVNEEFKKLHIKV